MGPAFALHWTAMAASCSGVVPKSCMCRCAATAYEATVVNP